MSFVASAILGGSALTAGASIWGANTAANAQTSAERNALNFQGQMFNTVQGAAQPFINAGQSFLPTLQSLLTPGANLTSTLSQLPGFQFANTYGNKAITNQATMSGLSGNALTAGANYSSGLAQNTYSSLVQQLLQGVGIGQQGVNTLAGAANQFSTNGSNAITGAGNAGAAGAIGTAGAIGGLGSNLSNLALLSSLTGTKAGLFGSNNNAAPTPQATPNNPWPQSLAS